MTQWACQDVASGKLTPAQAATIFDELNAMPELKQCDVARTRLAKQRGNVA